MANPKIPNPSGKTKATEDTYLTPTYARTSFTLPNNDSTMNENEMDPREVREMISNRLDSDMANSNDLGSYNFDYMDPEADDMRMRVIGKVYIDKETYVQTAAMGDAVPTIIQNWYGGIPLTAAEKADNRLIGTVTIGSSEAIMLGLITHRQNWYDKWVTSNAGSSGNVSDPAYLHDRPLLMYARDVHTCWDKYSLYYNTPALVFNLSDGNYLIDPVKVGEYLRKSLYDIWAAKDTDQTSRDFWEVIEPYLRLRYFQYDSVTLNYAKNRYLYELVCCVGAVVGTTFTGQGDDVEQLNQVLVELKEQKGVHIPIHVDAASGGFVVPFTAPDMKWDFRLDHVSSINVSNHKFGATYPGCGTVVFRDGLTVPKELIWQITYLGGSFTDFTVNFSRDSAGPLSAYYNLQRFGLAGYQKQSTQCVENATYLAAQINAMSYNSIRLFETLSESDVYPMVIWKMTDAASAAFAWDLIDLGDVLQEDGWKLPAYNLPYTSSRKPDGPLVSRVVTRPDVSREKIDILLGNILEQVAFLADTYPKSVEGSDIRRKQKKRLETKGPAGDYGV